MSPSGDSVSDSARRRHARDGDWVNYVTRCIDALGNVRGAVLSVQAASLGLVFSVPSEDRRPISMRAACHVLSQEVLQDTASARLGVCDALRPSAPDGIEPSKHLFTIKKYNNRKKPNTNIILPKLSAVHNFGWISTMWGGFRVIQIIWIIGAWLGLPDVAGAGLICPNSIAWHWFVRVAEPVRVFIAVKDWRRRHCRPVVASIVCACMQRASSVLARILCAGCMLSACVCGCQRCGALGRRVVHVTAGSTASFMHSSSPRAHLELRHRGHP